MTDLNQIEITRDERTRMQALGMAIELAVDRNSPRILSDAEAFRKFLAGEPDVPTSLDG